MTWLRGVDASHWQGEIDWAVLSKRVAFAFVKATQGLTHVDPQFVKNWHGSRERVIRGAYHFWEPDADPIQQALHFVRVLTVHGDGDTGELPPVLDLERGPTTWDRVQAFMETVEDKLGRTPILYTSPGFARSLGLPPGRDLWPLWVAHYDVPRPSLPPGWTAWVFWQYTVAEIQPEEWGVQSRRLDMNYFQGGWPQLVRFCMGRWEPKPSVRTQYRVTAWRLNVRSGPGVNFPRVGQLRRGDVVYVDETAMTDRYSPWGHIGEGRWISLQYVEPVGG